MTRARVREGLLPTILVRVRSGNESYEKSLPCLINHNGTSRPKGFYIVSQNNDSRTATVSPAFAIHDSKGKLIFKSDYKWKVNFPHEIEKVDLK